MKKTIFIFALLFSFFTTVNAQKDKLDQLFEKYQETDGVTSIKIAKPMFNMLNKLNINDSELDQIKPLLSKINGLKILIVEKPETKGTDEIKQLNMFQNLQSDISNSIKNLKYEELMTVNSKDNKIKFLSSDATNGILDNLLLSINSEGNTVLMMLDGKISIDDVNKLVNEAQNTSLKSSLVTENVSPGGVTQVRSVGKFTGIKASSGIKVNFTQGNNQSVVVETDPNLQEYVSTEVKDGILVISINNKNNKKLNFKKLLVTVEAPRLSSVDVSSGASLMTVNTIKENNFKAEVSSGANLNADVIAEKTVDVAVSSGSTAKLDVQSQSFILTGTSGSSSTVVGKTANASFDLTSAASCNANDFIAKSATVSATSGSNLRVQATEALSGSASSGATIRYKGNPKIENGGTKTSSGASIKPLN
ncbi:DUF4252 domain-containing protein [Kaistella faecalis]|uniref:DUF4252 domain-containing protein n=1 Tax=Kaistella faecalis TaxID=2852098 RepID=UPI001C4953A4|nr:DUF4252 domain-containing protein [Chryseobacterium faecale]UFK98654.1 DUF4252 domain-containing protein [Chryseobacterium faecale]